MSEIRKFKIIVDSKELCTCSGSSPSSVAKKAVKKLCDGSKKIVKFSLKECKRDCKKVCGPYQGHMEKLDKPYKRKGKTITHKAVCEKVQIKKMKGGIINKNKLDKLDKSDFLVEMDPKNSPLQLKIREMSVIFGKKKTYFIFFNIQTVNENSEENSGLKLSEGNNNESLKSILGKETSEEILASGPGKGNDSESLESRLGEGNDSESLESRLGEGNNNANLASGPWKETDEEIIASRPMERNNSGGLGSRLGKKADEEIFAAQDIMRQKGGVNMYYTYVVIKYSNSFSKDVVIFKKLDVEKLDDLNVNPVKPLEIILIPKLSLVKLYQDIITSTEFIKDNNFAKTIRDTIKGNVSNIELYIKFLTEKDENNMVKSLKLIGNSIFFRVIDLPCEHYKYVATIDHIHNNIVFELVSNILNPKAYQDYNNLYIEEIHIYEIQNHVLEVFLRNLTIMIQNNSTEDMINLLFIRDHLFVYLNMWVETNEVNNTSNTKIIEDDIATYIFFSLKINNNKKNTTRAFFFEYVFIRNKKTKKITFINISKIKQIKILYIKDTQELYEIQRKLLEGKIPVILRNTIQQKINEELKSKGKTTKNMAQINEGNSTNHTSVIRANYVLTEQNKPENNKPEKIKIITVGTRSGRVGNKIIYIFFNNVNSFDDDVKYNQFVVIKYSKGLKNIVVFKKIKYKKDDNPEIKDITIDEIKKSTRLDHKNVGNLVLEKLYQDIISSNEVKSDPNFATTIRDELKKNTEYHKEEYLKPPMFYIKKSNHNKLAIETTNNCNIFVNDKYIFFSNNKYGTGNDAVTKYDYVVFINDKNMISFKELIFFNGTHLILPIKLDREFRFVNILYKSINQCNNLMIGINKSDIALKILYKLEEYILNKERNELKSRDFYITVNEQELVIKKFVNNKSTYIFFNRLSNDSLSYDSISYILYNYVLIKKGDTIIFKEAKDINYDLLLIGKIEDIDPMNIDIVILANLYESLDQKNADELQIRLLLTPYVEKYINFKNWVESILQSKITFSERNHSKKITNIDSISHDIGIVGQFTFDFMKEYKKNNRNRSIQNGDEKKWLDIILETKDIKKKSNSKNTYSFDPKLSSIIERGMLFLDSRNANF